MDSMMLHFEAVCLFSHNLGVREANKEVIKEVLFRIRSIKERPVLSVATAQVGLCHINIASPRASALGPQGCPRLCLHQEPRIKYNARSLRGNPKGREGGRNLSGFYKHIHGFALPMPALAELSTGRRSGGRPRVRVSGAF